MCCAVRTHEAMHCEGSQNPRAYEVFRANPRREQVVMGVSWLLCPSIHPKGAILGCEAEKGED